MTAAAPTTVLRPMAVGDVEDVLLIETRSQASPWSSRFLRGELDDPTRAYLVATAAGDRGRSVDEGELAGAGGHGVQGERIVGFAGVLVAVDEAHITNIAVDPEHRRAGIGRLLLEGLLREAVGRGATAATLEVRAGNTAARRLYARRGFVPAGIRPGYYAGDPAEDAVIMWLHDLRSADAC